ncbi:transglutaminase-like cysteine peptidase, partial [Candidatus Pacearchaeota archaeon]|nr:transglutaminase-like cysteine peptidase [Candidatus Pacearchaeota archaeon]
MNLWSMLQNIHYDIKFRFTYMSDKSRYGQDEYWARPSESFERDGRIYGDCEDFALACQESCKGKIFTIAVY